MKKLLVCMFALVFALAAGPAFAQTYSTSIGTEATISPGGSVVVDISVTGLPENLVSDGVMLTYDNALIEITAVGIYDGGTGGAIPGTGPVATYSSLGGCWDGAMTGNAWAGPGVILLTVGTTAACPSSGTDDMFARVTFECMGAGDAAISLNDTVLACVGVSGEIDITNDPLAITIHQEEAVCTATITPDPATVVSPQSITFTATSSDDCSTPNYEWSDDCSNGDIDPESGVFQAADTDVAEDCTVSVEDTANGAVDTAALHIAEKPDCTVTLRVEEINVNPSDSNLQLPVIMSNESDVVSGIETTLVDAPDSLTCIACVPDPVRAPGFMCFASEQADGGCKVLMFDINGAALIATGNGAAFAVNYVFTGGTFDECISVGPADSLLLDADDVPINVCEEPGSICPIVCGDVYPDESSPDANDCGDGMVNIIDILTEVDFVLTIEVPSPCQASRADVPTGTPPDCIDPDDVIDIRDIMVLIDMSLDRENCCTF